MTESKQVQEKMTIVFNDEYVDAKRTLAYFISILSFGPILKFLVTWVRKSSFRCELSSNFLENFQENSELKLSWSFLGPMLKYLIKIKNKNIYQANVDADVIFNIFTFIGPITFLSFWVSTLSSNIFFESILCTHMGPLL